MKTINRAAVTAAALIFIGSSVFAQSLADAKKAIDAEQYQKAKTMLKNLTVTQPTSDENYFYLGWVYVNQDYADSAKTAFNKGISINPKSALNYAGLGAASIITKDQSGATASFNQALQLAGKDPKPYDYVGRAYLLPVPPATVVSSANANAAIATLEKGKTINAKIKDADLMVNLGDAYLSQLKSNEAFNNYRDALAADPKSVTAHVAQGVLWRQANNWESAESEFKAALAIDPNFGPAYREWAETNLRQSKNDPKNASVKVHEGVEHYRTYLSLTDMSLESQLRYADFLYNVGEFKTLQEVTTNMTKYANTNLRVYRYIGYSALENKDYPAGIAAMNQFISKADQSRVLANDYLTLGKLKMAAGDSTGIDALRKAYNIDTTKADVFLDIAVDNYKKGKYKEAGDAYYEYFAKSHKGSLTNYYQAGNSYYKAYTDQYYSTAIPKPKPDSTLLIKADTAFYYVQHTATTPVATVALYQARAHDFLEPSRTTTIGLAKPYYEQYIQLTIAKTTIPDSEKKFLGEAYAYLGNYYAYKEKDDAKAAENFNKAKEYEPDNKSAAAYFANKPGAKSK